MADVGAVVLAAGGSSRLGEPKQLIEIRGETFVHSAVRAAQEGGGKIVCVVTGDVHDRVASAVADLHPLTVRNENWRRGIGSSICAGVQRITRENVSAVVLLTCDQPALNSGVMRALIARREETGRAIVASHYAGALGVPALFDKTLWPELLRLPDESGAKSIIELDPSRVATIDFPDGAIDIDTAADFAVLSERKTRPVRWSEPG